MSEDNNAYKDEMREAFSALTSDEKIKQFGLLRADKESAEAHLKELNKRYDFMRTVLIPEWMDDQGLSIVKSPEFGRITLQGDAHVSCPADQKQALHTWLTDRGLTGMIQETINASTLKAMVKDRMRSNEEIPECLKVLPYTKAVLSKK